MGSELKDRNRGCDFRSDHVLDLITRLEDTLNSGILGSVLIMSPTRVITNTILYNMVTPRYV